MINRPFVSSKLPDLRFEGKSSTIQGDALTIREIIQRFESGNIIGLSNNSTEFDSDDQDFDEDTPLFIDPADPLLSVHEHSLRLNAINERKEKYLASIKRKADEAIEAEKQAFEKWKKDQNGTT